MPERRSLLVFPESVDIDILPYSLLGWAFDDIEAYWERWRQPLLESGKSIGVFVSIPYHELDDIRVRSAWEEEKTVLKRTFKEMSRLGVEVDGVHDLSGRPAEEAREVVRDLLLKHKQVVGIAHVAEAYSEVPLNIDKKLQTALRDIEARGDIPLEVDFVIKSEEKQSRLLYRYPLESMGQRPIKPQPALWIRFQTAPYFLVGKAGRLDREFFLEVTQNLGAAGNNGLRGRAIFVGCRTAPSGLARDLVESGLAIVGLGTPRTISLSHALALLRAVLIAGFQPAKQAIWDIVTITAKLLGFPQYGSTPSFLVTKSSVGFPNGEDAFYWVYRTSSLSLPELEPVTKEEVEERLKKAANYEDWMIVDVPPEIRGEMAEVLRGKPVLWPARGASCASVAAPFSALEPENVIYQLGYVGKAPRGLVFRLLSEFTCLSVQNFANSRVSNILPFDHEIELPALLNQLQRLCRSGATLVVAAVERAVLGE